MRSLLRARDTAIVVAMACFACTTPKPPRAAPTPKPPPHVVVVGLEQVALRTTAWVELHAWLAAAARSSAELPDPALDGAARAYREVLLDDVRDELVTRTARVLEACEDARCAETAVTGTRFAKPYLDALPGFLLRHWMGRATLARTAVEGALGALGPEEVQPLVRRLAQDLAIDWPREPVIVDVVGDAPAAGREAPIRMLLATHGSCFAGAGDETKSVHDARIIDCVLAYAALRLDSRSTLATALAAELRALRRPDDFGRAWTALVVHAVAVTVSALEPKHTSPLRRSAAATMPEAMEWLAHEWPSRMRGERAVEFAKRYAEVIVRGPN
jgi:hypothetical protein